MTWSLLCGGTPVFADFDEQTYNICPIEKKITSDESCNASGFYGHKLVNLDNIIGQMKREKLCCTNA